MIFSWTGLISAGRQRVHHINLFVNRTIIVYTQNYKIYGMNEERLLSGITKSEFPKFSDITHGLGLRGLEQWTLVCTLQ